MAKPSSYDPADPKTWPPELVRQVIVRHLLPIEQDVNRLRNLREADDAYYRSKNEPKPTLSEFLRKQLVTPGAKNFDERHPHVLDCCRRLGVDAVAVDELVELLRSGDVSDKRAVELMAKAGLHALETARDGAHEQWLDENATIVSVDSLQKNRERRIRPRWDADSSSLYLGDRLVRRVRRTARWRVILATFEEEGWPDRILIPLPPEADPSEALRQLNRGLEGMRFRRDGGGEGILWEAQVPAE